MSRLLALLGLVALPAAAQTLDPPNLSIVPRTPAEAGRVAGVLAPPAEFRKPEPFEAMPGGAASVRARGTADAFSQSSANMPFDREMDFKLGNGLFRKLWVASPSSTQASDGLGPLYNARGCQNCHLKDGRGHVPEGPEDEAVSMFLRLSVPGGPAPEGIEDWIATQAEPTYGGQLQDFAAAGHAPEGRMRIDWQEVPVTLADGTVVTLRRPAYSVSDLGYGPMAADVMLSPRVTPQMIGLGLLEAIPAADILAHADPDDRDGDGISGRPNIVWSEEAQAPMLGRFGLKAGAPTVLQQSAAAFAGDMGIANALFPEPWGECTAAQSACRTAVHGIEPGKRDGLEIDRKGLDLTAFYARNLAVPERRRVDDSQVLRGKQMFHEAGCPACHVPKFVTHRLNDQPEQSFQLIWPHTDLLLHDMGEGLADNRPEGRATGREWRTPPLWGIGLTELVSGHQSFLHDGRARSLLEAVLWHGGEAEAARSRVISLPAPDREALIAFLESL
ncbi:thiol oxidoreductase [Cereibacter sphaeroides]|uniref:di-heme oxidoreductase family protein n=1 Tax=Cereibacter sphaeroides TaxID=1063 RepID=UPI001F3FCAAD|nr:di-heme oxidoredictase family protein [Cereibacter sphaeroides]MCE6958939.1 thiol oxidoreductase [Cereibacter sphaeroides]MCE6973577.1 thiol oxidoreductase [Cereibacter sphaeroides]